MKKGNIVFIAIVILFLIGIVIGGSLNTTNIDNETGIFEEEVTSPENNYDDLVVVSSTENVFVIVGVWINKLITKGITFIVEIISKIFGFIFGL